MRRAETVLDIIHKRGERGLPIENVYRQLFNPDLYLGAYGRIYRNDGAMTQGATEETVDEMSLKKIQNVISKLRFERLRWTSVRRTYIPKKNRKLRPLGIPTWSDKLVQEVMRSILEAYFEPQFNDRSHGFRPNRGCHTALRSIQRWGGVNWFIEGDIQGCFDNIDHDILLSILKEKIQDNRFIRLVGNLLKAGYLEDWTIHPTLSGAPQGGIVSPILSNIYLDRLDQFVETELIPRFTTGKNRRPNRQYTALIQKRRHKQKLGDVKAVKELRNAIRQTPSKDTTDPDYRRLYYVRYADDFLIGFSGPKAEAVEIKILLREFLSKELKLTLSEEKTLITHANTGAARFLGYEIKRFLSNTRCDQRGRRSINTGINLRVPKDAVRERYALYTENEKPASRKDLVNEDDYTILTTYQNQYRGYVQYYIFAHNLGALKSLRWVMETSLLKTLARKYQVSVSKIAERYRSEVETPEGRRRCFEAKIERGDKKPLVARFGGIPLKRQQMATIQDQPKPEGNTVKRAELVQRVLAQECELCGITHNIQVHHIRKLADLNVKGKKAKPEWIKIMASRRRKTLVVCEECHQKIHHGRIDQSLPQTG